MVKFLEIKWLLWNTQMRPNGPWSPITGSHLGFNAWIEVAQNERPVFPNQKTCPKSSLVKHLKQQSPSNFKWQSHAQHLDVQDFHHCNYGMPRDRIEWSERARDLRTRWDANQRINPTNGWWSVDVWPFLYRETPVMAIACVWYIYYIYHMYTYNIWIYD